jgi:arylsulfatase A-like enzyme
MFERGIFGHMTPLLHQPLVHIPLVIFEPGQKIREDIYEKTSAVDILPTLLHLSGKSIPSWAEGQLLPPYGPTIKDRSVFALEAKKNQRFKPLTTAGAMIIKDKFKLTYYWGYRSYTGKHPQSELFNIDSDPEELNEISEEYPDITEALVEEVMEKINKADEPYL